jgi:hypothetical protein
MLLLERPVETLHHVVGLRSVVASADVLAGAWAFTMTPIGEGRNSTIGKG